MGKYLKLSAVLCFSIGMVQLGALEWNVSSNVSVQPINRGNPSAALERWTTGQGRFWDEQYWRAGDFNGDGADDLARVYRDGRTISIDIYCSDKKGFVFENWALQQGLFRDEQHWRAGDFNGDGADDLVSVFRDGRTASMDVYLSGKKSFTMKNWSLQQGRFWDEQHWQAGDFNGDGVDDVARVYRDGRTVSIDVYCSDKNKFVLKNWVSQQGRFRDNQYWRAGDFNGDGADDLARVFQDGRNVSVDVYRSSKNGFVLENWASQQGRFWDNQYWRAGDFDGDGADDLARVFRDGRNVSIDTYRSNKNRFVLENWVSQQGRFRDDQYWRAGDFNGDGADDIARAFRDNRNVSIDVYLSGN